MVNSAIVIFNEFSNVRLTKLVLPGKIKKDSLENSNDHSCLRTVQLKTIRKIGSLIGWTLSIIPYFLFASFWLQELRKLLGGILGLIVGIVLLPLAPLTPILVWIEDGSFPIGSLWLWGLMFLGVLLANICNE